MGNNRTKSVLVRLQGVVKKAVGLDGWHWLVGALSSLRFEKFGTLSGRRGGGVVDPFVLEEEPFRALMRMAGAGYYCGKRRRCGRADEIVFAHVHSILFEHLLWLVGRQDYRSESRKH